MDGNRFDDLVRGLAHSAGSRRRLIKGGIAGLVAAVGYDRRANAALKRSTGQICRKNGDCASNVCLPRDRTGRQYCGCGTLTDCGISTTCTSVICESNRCSTVIAAPGTPCSDGNSCTTGDHCENGVCVNGSPVSCDEGQICFNGNCCTPTCGPNDDSCDTPVSDGCGGTITCKCLEGQVCTTSNTCCTPTCGPNDNSCDTPVADGCGGTITCKCSESQVCSAGVCVTDDTGAACEIDTDCLSGNCAQDPSPPNSLVCCPAEVIHCGGTCCQSSSAICYTGGCCESGWTALSSTICCPVGTTLACSTDCCTGTQTCVPDSYNIGNPPICCDNMVCNGVCCPTGTVNCDGSGNCVSENP